MEKQSKRPENMPRQVKAEKPKLKKEQGGEVLPPQQPLTDEEALPKKTPRWKKIVRRVLAWVAVALALALCYLLHPQCITQKQELVCHVDISGGAAYGRTVVDRRKNLVTEQPNCVFAEQADAEFFYNWMYTILKNAADRV